MSEPVTNLEVEDVLSSIRRLVSEELPIEQAAPSKDAEKFVLTPALRVAEPDDAAPLFQHHGSSHSHDHSEQTESEPQSNDHHGETEAEAITEAWQDAQSDAETTTLEDRIAELEAAVGRAGEEWEPDGSEPDAGVMPKTHLFQVVGRDHFEHNVVQAHEVEAAPMAVDVPSEPLVLDGPVMPIRAIASETDDESENAAKKKLGDLTGDDLLLDEEALREMVAEIVRQELMGSVGERMTRNVRRMVRREIQRALALKDFE